ncbi:MAG: hypothetical protein A2252_10805 [Elusimicrobia bacterium RIFOXYA2_FULL_39_19]|nr:MAG: hypothetical protein A2252_10805 [Elusimicrobia bacterium RIFOXYA2_FULL_39_19]
MNKTILVVDDEASIQLAIKTVFEDTYNVIMVSNTVNANRELKNNVIDLLMLDYSLPGKNGLDYLKELKQKQQNLPVVFMTAYGTEKIVSDISKLKNVYYLSKLFDVDELVKLVNEILGEHQVELKKINPSAVTLSERERKVLNDIIGYIKERFTQKITCRDIAVHFQMKEAEIKSIFILQTGKTIQEYINTYRMLIGKHLLKSTNQSIEQISKRIGFKSKDTFHRLFIKHFNQTPGKLRIKK